MTRKHVLMLLLITVYFISTAQAFAATNPYIFYSDLLSGPNYGGQNGQGAIVTIYGTSFGDAQGSSYITVGGGAAANYLSWSDKKIAFQLGSQAVSGRIVVHAGGSKSNGINFAVRSGNIRFVSVKGADAADGSYSSPWRTITRALSSLSAGDIVYVMDGVQQLTPDSNGAALTISSGGYGYAPIALVAYPAANVQIGSGAGTNYGIYATSSANWIIAGMQISGSAEALRLNRSSGWRIVANDVSCPIATAAGACIDATRSGSAKVFGNIIHDSGAPGSAQPQFDALLFTYGNGIAVAWNEISRTNGCRAVHVKNPSWYQSNLQIHNNWIHDSMCDAISLDSVDPSSAPVTIYNNVVARAGTGPYPGGNSSFTCVSVAGSGNGTVQISNNTFYDCGAQGGANAGALAATTPAELDDTIVDLKAGENYLATGTGESNWSGSNNLLNGSSGAPGVFTATVSQDPTFLDPAHDNYQLDSTSPAIDAGISTNVNRDFLGVARPQNAAFDIGAFEYVGTPGTTTSKGQLQATPATLNFTGTNVGTSSTQNVTVANTGTVAVNVSQAAVSGNGFSIPQASGSTSIAPGASIVIQVVFSPTAVTSYAGSLTIASDAANASLSIPLSGSGTQAPQAQIAASPTPLGFGNVSTGSSKTQSVTISNSGNASATISQIGATGPGFSIAPIATPYLLAAGAALTVQVTFSPTSVTTYSGGLSIASDAPSSPLSVPLTGSGVQPPQGQLAATPSAVAFGNVNTGSGITQTVSVKNSGNASATINQLATTGTGFSTTGIAMPYTLAAGATVSIQVTFSPTSVTTYSGGLSIASDTPNSPLNIPLTGAGVQPPQAQLTATPIALAFGSVNTGSSTMQTVTLKNAGNASATITQLSAAGTGFSTSGVAVPYTLAAGATVSIPVTFAPTSVTSYNGALAIVSDAPNSPLNIPLTGAGAQPPQAQLTATPIALAFGSVNTGSSTMQTVTLKNAGNASATITQLSAAGTGFSTSGVALPYILAAGATLSVPVTFAPTSVTSYSGTLAIVSNAPNSPLNVPLTGAGVQPPQAQLTASPIAVAFGSVNTGSSTMQTVTLKNAGNASATITQLSATGTGFSTSGVALPYTLAAGATVSVPVTFAPTSVTSYSGALAIVSNAPNSPLNVPLTGASVQPPLAQLAASPTAISFGSVTVGTNSTQTLTLNNTGNASATITQLVSSGAGFAASSLAVPYTLPSGASMTVQITFSPSSAIAYSGSVNVSSNASNSSVVVPLSGTGAPVPQAQLSPNPTNLNFGNIAVGSTASKTVVLTNTGNASATISQIAVNGPGFVSSGLTLPSTLAAGATVSFQITFSPTAASTYAATVVLTSTAGNSPTSIPITGTGTTIAPQHSVALSWTDGDTGLSGFNVYRAVQTGGPYTKATTSLLSSASWTDTSVQAGQTYYYVVTAVNASGQESAHSTEVTAIIPTP